MLNGLKWIVAPREMAELERRRAVHEEYRRCLASLREAAAVLDNLEAEVRGQQPSTDGVPHIPGACAACGRRDVPRNWPEDRPYIPQPAPLANW